MCRVWLSRADSTLPFPSRFRCKEHAGEGTENEFRSTQIKPLKRANVRDRNSPRLPRSQRRPTAGLRGASNGASRTEGAWGREAQRVLPMTLSEKGGGRSLNTQKSWLQRSKRKIAICERFPVKSPHLAKWHNHGVLLDKALFAAFETGHLYAVKKLSVSAAAECCTE